MILKCDRCEKPIQVENPTLGQKVTCPACGDVNIVRQLEAPTPTAAPAPVLDRAADAGYPPALGPEVDVMMVRPAMFRARPLRFILVCAIIGVGFAGAFYLGTGAKANVYLAAASAGAAALGLLYLVVWKVHTLSEGLKITTKRTIDQHGLFSKDTSDVLHVDIKNIQIKQSFADRMWGVGQIALSSSAENEEEIVIRNVPDPEKVRRVIDLYRQL